MFEPTKVTWILVIFGAVTLLPLFFAQLVILFRPDSKNARDILIGKGEDWRDNTHFRSAYGLAWADWLLLLPLAVSGSIGVLTGHSWGYVLWACAGALSLYINIYLWILERKYVYPSCGPLAYYTYYWGFFVYWGAAAVAYSVIRLSGVSF